MKKQYLSVVPILGATLMGCSPQKASSIRETYFTDNAIVYEIPAHKTDTLRGEKVISEAIGAYNLVVVDSIICLPDMAPEPVFFLYDLDGRHLLDIGQHGQGPNDFLSNLPNKQVLKKNGESSVLIVDVNAAALKQLNLSKSLREGKAVVDSIYPFTPMEKFAGLSGYRLVEEGRCDGNYELLIKSTDDYTLLHREKLYLIDCVENDPIAYWSSMSISPDGRYLIMALNSLNEINILDLNDFSRLTVSVGNVKTYKEFCDREYDAPDWEYYTGVSLTNDLIFALYSNEPWTIDDSIDHHTAELQVLGYDGSLKLIAPFDRRIRGISYSSIDKSIYALDFDDNVWQYPLPSFEQAN